MPSDGHVGNSYTRRVCWLHRAAQHLDVILVVHDIGPWSRQQGAVERRLRFPGSASRTGPLKCYGKCA